MVKPTLGRSAFSEELREEINSSLGMHKAKRESSKVTDEAKEHGIKVFSMKDYMDDKALIYIPNMPIMEIDGVRVKWHSPVTTHRLNKLGEKSKYAGMLRSTLNIDKVLSEKAMEIFGVDGRAQSLLDYISKSYDYKRAQDELSLAKLGLSSESELSSDEWKKIQTENYKYLPISSGDTSYWFPVVVIPTEKGKDGKSTYKPEGKPKLDKEGNPVLDEKGKVVKVPYGELMWYKASEKTFKERLAKAVDVLMLDEGETYEGNLFSFNYTIKEDEDDAKKSKNTGEVNELMRSANSLGITVIQNGGKQAKLYKMHEKLFAQWDKQAQEEYTHLNLALDVLETLIKSDEEVEALLGKEYGKIDQEIEKLHRLAEVQLGSGEVVSTGKSSVMEKALGQSGAKQIESNTDDSDDDLDFDLDE